MRIGTIGLVVLLGGLLWACVHSDEVYSRFHSFAGAEWEQADAVDFEVPVRDAALRYRVMIQVRNNNRYPFRNLWLFVDCRTPDGSVRCDTVCADLADAYGKWYGTGIGLYNYSFPYQAHVVYPDTGVYRYTIRHAMRMDTLRGVADVGVRVERE
jgi:gliding motility-associated lipoprotein GldH